MKMLELIRMRELISLTFLSIRDAFGNPSDFRSSSRLEWTLSSGTPAPIRSTMFPSMNLIGGVSCVFVAFADVVGDACEWIFLWYSALRWANCDKPFAACILIEIVKPVWSRTIALHLTFIEFNQFCGRLEIDIFRFLCQKFILHCQNLLFGVRRLRSLNHFQFLSSKIFSNLFPFCLLRNPYETLRLCEHADFKCQSERATVTHRKLFTRSDPVRNVQFSMTTFVRACSDALTSIFDRRCNFWYRPFSGIQWLHHFGRRYKIRKRNHRLSSSKSINMMTIHSHYGEKKMLK